MQGGVMRRNLVILCVSVLPLALVGCGLYVPEKNALAPDTIDSNKYSSGGKYEIAMVRHISCEIAVGLRKAYNDVLAPEQPKPSAPVELVKLPWLKSWGTAITLAITAEDQSGLSPGLSLATPFANKVFTFPTGGPVVSSQSFSLGIGGSATANATRAETIQFTLSNAGLIYFTGNTPEGHEVDDICKTFQNGVMIDSDLKIWEFIYDKAVIAANSDAAPYVPITKTELQPSLGEDGKPILDAKGKPETKLVTVQTGKFAKHPDWPLYNTFTENITFTTTFGGNVTPTWKLARVSADSSGTLLSATRTNTNQLTITMGPIQTQQTATSQLQLQQGAQIQHDNTVLSNQIKGP
jgi:hypothetical protein